MAEIPDNLTREFLLKNREYDIGSPFHHWRALPWKQVVLLEVSGTWELSDCPYYMKEIWDIFSERREHYEKVYLLINANAMDIQSEGFRQYLKESWGHLLDREDLVICLIEEKAMKRAIWSSIYRLIGKRDRIKIFAGYEGAFVWLTQRLRAEVDVPHD
jgi:hypothetical protein